MGVPKFFRYISERYPCLSEVVKEYQIPQFDNLYLDMNGIIHMCSHPDDDNVHFRITEEKIFKDIFHYIEVLFRMIKPQKLFFMAVDGVAPRAKMNQQRGRRFRSAKDAEKREHDAAKKGELLPDEARFDSNCITPGTVFMARLQKQLQYFIVDKISNDPLWQNCKVILSGHETPGEGEHKIMDYIRYMRSQPGYDPNTRHCLYGLDADLIMLGLCTHEPHFSLLREEVKFGKKSTKRISVPEEITFFLLHLSLMREYLELEFTPVKEKLRGFEFDIEKIIDDWVLMGFLVGNDFIPHLPFLHITNGALPILYKAYMEILPTLDGYINEAGTLNLVRFARFMEKLGSIDVQNFEEIREDVQYMESKTGRKHIFHSKVSAKSNEGSMDDSDIMGNTFDSGLAALIQETDDLDDSEEEEDYDEFANFKKEYYQNKLEYLKVTPEVLQDQAEGYVRAIQWNLNYYYNGCCSWSWYYPHHYAPYISDVKGFSNFNIKFDKGKPFLPFEQLLAVLPSASKDLLPRCYHNLMTAENSLISKYYPDDFQTDLNGKKQEWEAVVLVPFIDEQLLLEAMSKCNGQLTEEEKQRNGHGPMFICTYTPNDNGVYLAPEYFPPVTHNHTEVKTMMYDEILVPEHKLVKGAYPGARKNVYYPGFPTMRHLKYKAEIKEAKIKVFETPSRNENMIVSIIPDQKFTGEQIPVDLLGTNVFINWPHLTEAHVVAISHEKRRYVSMGGPLQYDTEEKTPNLIKQFDQEIQSCREYFLKKMGVDVGTTKVLVQVKPLIGRKYVFGPNGQPILEKQFAPQTTNYPLQAVVFNITTYDGYKNTSENSIENIFPINSTCFTLTNPYYGSQGVVQENLFKKNGRIKICVSVSEEPDFTEVRQLYIKTKSNFRNLYSVASQLSVSNGLFSRITGTIFATVPNNEGNFKNVNIGLDLKLNKRNKETPGYTKKIGNTWWYTDKALGLVHSYIEKFPEIFEHLTRDSHFDDIEAEKLFGDNWEEKLKEVQSWLKSQPVSNLEKRTCGSEGLEPEVVTAIEEVVDNFKSGSTKRVTMQIKPNFLYTPKIQTGTLIPDPKMDVRILDRIVNVRQGFSVPFGLKGTIVAIQQSPTDSERDIMYDIVFDKPFTDGMKLNCSEGRGYRLPKTSFINLSYGQRLLEEKTGKPDEVIAKANSLKNPSNDFNAPQSSNQWFQKQFGYNNTQNYFGQTNSAFAQFDQKKQYGTSMYDTQSKQTLYNPYNNQNTHNNYNRQNNQERQPDCTYQQQNNNRQNYNQGWQQNFKYGRQQSSNNEEEDQNTHQNYKSYRNDDNGSENYKRDTKQSYQESSKNKQSLKLENQGCSSQDAGNVQNVYSRNSRNEQQIEEVTKTLNKLKTNESKKDFMPKVDSSNDSRVSNSTSQKDKRYSKKSGNLDVKKQQNQQQEAHKVNTEFLKNLLGLNKCTNMEPTPSSTNIIQPSKKIVEKKEETISFNMLAAVADAPASVKLITYYQSNGLGLPRYQYFNCDDNMTQAQIKLADGRVIIGKPAGSKEQASENVAEEVIELLINKTPSQPKGSSENIPTPPTSWVQADSKQTHTTVHSKVTITESSTSKNRTDTSAVLNNSFVPLQAVKNLIKNNTANSNKPDSSKENIKVTENKNENTRFEKVKNNSSENKSRSARKTRIAANFQKKE